MDKLREAYEAGGKNSRSCTLILAQGDAALALAIAGLPVVYRCYYGVYPIQGKLLNVREASTTQITNDKDLQNIKEILGLRENTKSLRYGRVMIMANNNTDGCHLKGLIINLFHYFWPTLLRVPSFLSDFITPTVKATHETEGLVKSFYSIPEYQGWRESLKGNTTGWTIRYYRVLGSSTDEEGRHYFSRLDLHQRGFFWEGDQDGEAIELAFCQEKIEARKNWLLNFKMRKPGTLVDRKEPKVTYSYFVNKELILSDFQRQIPSMVDGLTVGQRKILFCSFKRNFNKEATVDGNVLEEFFKLRLEYYEKRKKVMVKNLEFELLKLENEVKYISGILSREIALIRREKADFVQEMRQRGFTPFPKKSMPEEAVVAGAINATEESSGAPAPSSTFIPASDYDYLLSLPVKLFFGDAFEELCVERVRKNEEFEDLKKATPRDLWLRDLESLEILDLNDAHFAVLGRVSQAQA